MVINVDVTPPPPSPDPESRMNRGGRTKPIPFGTQLARNDGYPWFWDHYTPWRCRQKGCLCVSRHPTLERFVRLVYCKPLVPDDWIHPGLGETVLFSNSKMPTDSQPVRPLATKTCEFPGE